MPRGPNPTSNSIWPPKHQNYDPRCKISQMQCPKKEVTLPNNNNAKVTFNVIHEERMRDYCYFLFHQVGQLRTSFHLQLRPGQDKAKCQKQQKQLIKQAADHFVVLKHNAATQSIGSAENIANLLCKCCTATDGEHLHPLSNSFKQSF